MRKLVEDIVKKNFYHGATDLQESYIVYLRKDAKKPIPDGYCEDGKMSGHITDISKFVESLTDEELLKALDAQACERYR